LTCILCIRIAQNNYAPFTKKPAGNCHDSKKSVIGGNFDFTKPLLTIDLYDLSVTQAKGARMCQFFRWRQK
jgi:hypothetical protein